ncbi:hypothetical protein ACFZCL_10370 [Streptomyces sp. NPDC008159]|uniref:hypothetical protein n=1 Tax=Streptomyces sp. NPDC008159 TaxID=3364817 RepID=UPI0036E3C812
MQAAAWGALGSFTASVVALYVSWANGRRERRARDSAQEVDARQVIIEHVSKSTLHIANHTAMNVTDVRLERIIQWHDEQRWEAETYSTMWSLKNASGAWQGRWIGGCVLLPPGQVTACEFHWKASAPTTRGQPPSAMPDLQHVLYSFRDGHGLKWERLGHGPPLRRELETLGTQLSWHPATWLAKVIETVTRTKPTVLDQR